MMHSVLSLSTVLSLVLGCTAAAQSPFLTTLPECWQECASTQSHTSYCAIDDLDCICHFAGPSILGTLIGCLQRTCSTSDDLSRPLPSLQDVCRTTYFPVSEAAVAEISAAAELLPPGIAVKAQEAGRLELRTVALQQATPTSASPISTTTIPTEIMMASARPSPVASGNDERNDTIPSVSMPGTIFVTATASAKVHLNSALSNQGNSGTVLDMTSAASSRERGSLLGVAMSLLACLILS